MSRKKFSIEDGQLLCEACREAAYGDRQSFIETHECAAK